MKDKIYASMLLAGVCILCFSTLFFTSGLFVNHEVTSKWYASIFCILFFSFVYIIHSLVSSSFFRLKKNTFKISPIQIYLVIVIFCNLQSLYGILQYFHIFSLNEGSQMKGSFNNPAGFASSLCTGFPLLFYFVLKKQAWQRWLSIAGCLLIVSTVVLSASRSGIISLFVVVSAVLIYKVRVAIKLKIGILSIAFLIILFCLYFMKKDSADGRLLIWRCSWEMIKDQPLLGYGHGGFKAHYMDYQASYFEKNPESEYAMLADNVKYPFNEYLLLLTNYGFAGFILFLGFVGFMGYSFYRIRYKSIIIWISAWCLLSIAVFSFFSYPLIYPFVWIIGILSIIVIIRQAKYRIDISTKLIFSLKIIAVLVLILLLKETYQNVSAEMLWNNIAKNSLKGKTEQMLPIYEQLHKLLAGNEMFLYNYAAELNVVKEYDKSLQIAHECEKYLADYDLQMLIADNYQQLKQYKKAEVYYLKAANMCPVRFVPLYELEELYNTQGLNAEALSLARKIIKKPVKILSPTVIAIKQKMRQLIVEKEKTAVPETESRTSDQSKTTMPWSGRVPEIVSPDTTRPP